MVYYETLKNSAHVRVFSFFSCCIRFLQVGKFKFEFYTLVRYSEIRTKTSIRFFVQITQLKYVDQGKKEKLD